MIHPLGRCVIIILISMMLISCFTNVPPEKVYGTYVASYPFGTETLTLNQDGSFVQQVAIKGQPPVTVQGSWSSEPNNKHVILKGSMMVVDGFGKLRSDWRIVPSGIVAISTERLWFRVVLNSGGQYPYIKQ